MQILITGGFGYLAGRVAQALSEEGYKITLGSRQIRQPPHWLPQAKTIQMSWHSSDQLTRACQDVDIIIHAAGVNAQDSAKDPTEALNFNGVATARLAKVAAESGVKKFIYFSTAHVYSSPLVGSISEDSCPKNLHPYASSHLAGELAIMNPSFSNTMDCITLRLSNVYGAPTHKDAPCWTLLMNDLCRQAVEKYELCLKTNGQQIRDFISIKEVNNIVKSLILKDKLKSNSKIYNVGTGHSMTILEIAKIIQKSFHRLFNHKIPISLNDQDLSQPQSLDYQIRSLHKEGIFFNRKIDIDEIERLLQFCAQNFTIKEIK